MTACKAIAILGRGFLAHPANADLRRRLQSGELSTQDYYRQLLRLAYRLIFLFVAEDRNLLLVQDADAATREQYLRFYSATRLRELAARRRSGPHPDLYRTLRLVMRLLREGYPPLGCRSRQLPLFRVQHPTWTRRDSQQARMPFAP